MAAHSDILKEMKEQFKPLLENSPDGIYFWLNDDNMICNEKMAAMFGYSVEEMCKTPNFLNKFVAEESREFFSMNYHAHVASLAFPATFRFKGIRKDKSVFSLETDMIPFCWKNHVVAFHFVREIKE